MPRMKPPVVRRIVGGNVWELATAPRFRHTTFQNWTKVSPEIVGTVTLHADFTTPVDRVRQALREMVHGHPKWDGRTCALEVTDAQTRLARARDNQTAALFHHAQARIDLGQATGSLRRFLQ